MMTSQADIIMLFSWLLQHQPPLYRAATFMPCMNAVLHSGMQQENVSLLSFIIIENNIPRVQHMMPPFAN